ncbi:MAG: hypothetical protein Hyperionvirus2_190 [Hyperionvirus sp.]|uniref:Uncharacterized protein n=1 Tax=Hyperionvirus sp. TaxID=2487770 RepID=A0A3G5A712_9VIRU|nr:MAG: hypothetical protein Hyperionvirus2_190 [Hyperionvirus sp.]
MPCGETICYKWANTFVSIVGMEAVLKSPFCKKKDVSDIVLAVRYTQAHKFFGTIN